ncbi:peptidoglycan editing factor PgeF [Chlorobium phaeovibrioides]|uniref:Purine nucleoside phosphorylase n=1 Tax=Chlorobium phaeovibrioides TaxID=1094 RepID=A0A5M8IG66_CHLPH|nr:peptidoglycan editing factor PgeF [Chlorobium phaeovibrioides]KAA6233279.1 peptidoglycan editing factor PgeF [Chlorobium phaeovibrioides]
MLDTQETNPSAAPKRPKFRVPEIFRHTHSLLALETTRNGGVGTGPYSSLNLGSNTDDNPDSVRRNTELLFSEAGIDSSRTVRSQQVHGTEILHATSPGALQGYDAFITDTENLFLLIATADCYPILLFDPLNRAVAAIHAGWKGTAGHIAPQTVESMRRAFGTRPETLLASIGTGISGEAYEVSLDVAKQFPASCILPPATTGAGPRLDLGAANRMQLEEAGVSSASIESSPFCSFRDTGSFFSHRRDNGITGRMLSIIGLNQSGGNPL